MNGLEKCCWEKADFMNPEQEIHATIRAADVLMLKSTPKDVEYGPMSKNRSSAVMRLME